MFLDVHAFPKEWKNFPREQKLRLFWAVVIAITVFFPWISFSIAAFGGVPADVPEVRISGIESFGILSFCGALGYLLWKISPLCKRILPSFGFQPKNLEKMFVLSMLAGPSIWMLESGFHFAISSWALWLTFFAAFLLTIQTFFEKKLATLFRKTPSSEQTNTPDLPTV